MSKPGAQDRRAQMAECRKQRCSRLKPVLKRIVPVLDNVFEKGVLVKNATARVNAHAFPRAQKNIGHA